MRSRTHGSEEALARLACAGIRTRRAPRVVVGGLGMGYTLRAALDALPSRAEVLVAEIVPEVIAWNRGPLGELAGRPLDDPRVQVVEGDVGVLLARTRAAVDAIALDLDNGPTALARAANGWLYEERGLRLARRALRAGGALAIWAAGVDPRFTARLRRLGFAVTLHRIPPRGEGGGRKHAVWIARVPAARGC
jgi:spermidine synthase